MTMMQPEPTNSDSEMPRRAGTVAWLLVIGGALAWIVALVAVLLAVVGQDDDPGDPERVGLEPTLSAATATATLTPLPTATALPTATVTMTATATATLAATTTATSTAFPLPTATPLATVMPAAAPDGTISESAPETINGCAVPAGWERYTVQDGDTLFAFVLGAGADAGLTVDDLVAANCLTSRYLAVDQVLYLPPGAAENAPSSEPYVAASSLGVTGPRTPDCPCVITIPVGWRREQVAEAVQSAATSFTGGDFLTVTGADASAPYDFVQERAAGQSMEGFLFPGTYTVQNETTAEEFRNMLLDAFAANVSAQMRADAAAQGVTFYQALIIASVVQRESRTAETQKLIASVYYNNYRAGGRMGATVTVQYAVGRSGAWWPRVTASDLENASPFNTYNHTGLPPAPIDSPGLSAIVAAVYPPTTNYRFHTASCDGTGEAFAETYEEHLANVNCE